MHPYWKFNHYSSSMPHWHHYRRGPSRLLWFALGAVATSMYYRDKLGLRGEWMGHCKGVYASPPPRVAAALADDQDNDQISTAAANAPSGAVQHGEHGGARWGWHPSFNQHPPPPSAPPQQQQPEQPQYPQHPQQWPWDPADDRLAEMSKHASDTMTEITEATLDSVLSTAQALKTKLAEHRAEREKLQQKELERQREEARRNPPRLV